MTSWFRNTGGGWPALSVCLSSSVLVYLCLSVCLSVRLCLNLSVCLSVSLCQYVCLYVCLSVCLSMVAIVHIVSLIVVRTPDLCICRVQRAESLDYIQQLVGTFISQ